MLNPGGLRTTGRTGCIQHIGEIVGGCRLELDLLSPIATRPRPQTREGRRCRQRWAQSWRCYNERSGGIRYDEANPFDRIGWIKGEVGTARLVDRQHGNNQRRRARQRDADDDAGPDAKFREPPCQAQRAIMKFGVAQLLLTGN